MALRCVEPRVLVSHVRLMFRVVLVRCELFAFVLLLLQFNLLQHRGEHVSRLPEDAVSFRDGFPYLMGPLQHLLELLLVREG